MPQTAAIVTTCRDAATVIEFFVEYHLAGGFERIYLFFDDPRDGAIEVAKQYRQTTCIPNDGELRAQWRATPTYALWRGNPLLKTEVQLRQMMNSEIALQRALDDGIDWLLHIDIDELYFGPTVPVAAQLDKLIDVGSEQNIYLNKEAVPEAADIDHYFSEVTLFKRNPVELNPRASSVDNSWMSASQRAAVANCPALAEQFFMYYKNGKSIVRVQPGLVSDGVHGFRMSDRELQKSYYQDATVLHYACCGFEQFWQKYQTLGDFPDTWFGSQDIRGQIGSFHLRARDACNKGGINGARRFFEENVLISDPQLIEDLIRHNLLVRIEQPAAWWRERKK